MLLPWLTKVCFENGILEHVWPPLHWAIGGSTKPNNWRLALGPLHTRAKSNDHEIVRAQKKVSKGCPNTPPKSCSVITYPQV
jgi:hypothetical protein